MLHIRLRFFCLDTWSIRSKKMGLVSLYFVFLVTFLERMDQVASTGVEVAQERMPIRSSERLIQEIYELRDGRCCHDLHYMTKPVPQSMGKLRSAWWVTRDFDDQAGETAPGLVNFFRKVSQGCLYRQDNKALIRRALFSAGASDHAPHPPRF